MTAGSSGSRDVSQYELQLDDKRQCIPWQGRSPRVLTKMWKTISFEALPPGGLVEFPNARINELARSPGQLLLFIGG